MTDPEYEQKRAECWEEFCMKHPCYAMAFGRDIFYAAFDRAYALGKQFGNSEQPEARVEAKGGSSAANGGSNGNSNGESFGDSFGESSEQKPEDTSKLQASDGQVTGPTDSFRAHNRVQIASMTMQAILMSELTEHSTLSPKEVAQLSLEYADALIDEGRGERRHQ